MFKVTPLTKEVGAAGVYYLASFDATVLAANSGGRISLLLPTSVGGTPAFDFKVGADPLGTDLGCSSDLGAASKTYPCSVYSYGFTYSDHAQSALTSRTSPPSGQASSRRSPSAASRTLPRRSLLGLGSKSWTPQGRLSRRTTPALTTCCSWQPAQHLQPPL